MPNISSPRDNNRVPALIGVSNADGTTPVVVYADPTTHRLLTDVSISSVTVAGSKSNNAAVPGATNLGTLPAVATVAAPTYTEGYQVALSTDLTGAVRVTGTLSVGGTTDNSAFTAGTSTGTPAMAFYHSTIDTVTDGRAATIGMTSKRAMFVNLQTSAGAETGVAAVPLQVSLANTGANTNKLLVTPDANSAVNISQMNGVTVSMGAGANGTGVQRVTLATDQTAVTTAGVFSVKLDQTTVGTTNAVSVAQIGATTVVAGNGVAGNGAQRITIASDNSAVSGLGAGATGSAVPANAVYKGLQARTSNPSAATEGNTVGAIADKLGRQVVVIGNVRDNKGNQVTTITSSTSETTVVTAVASTFLDVYGCIVTNSSATATNVTFKDSTAGTTQYQIYVPAGETRGFMLPSSDAFKQTTVNNNWTATCGTSVASVVITMLYVKNI